jgi:tungstate transport system ATP-binding protein
MSELISISDLLIQRNGRDALTIQSLQIQRGETLAIVGPNGAGKSTLLLALARLIKPARGQITFNGSSISQMNDLEYRRKISFVFQDPLLMDMTVEKNIALGLKFRGVEKEETHARVNKWSKAMGVDSLLGRRAGQLSGGEAQRVSLARAFVLDPELLLMDEPFSSVDPQTRGQLMKDLSELLVQEHRTTIFVTHNLKEADMLASNMAVILNSRMQQVGPSGYIRLSPANAKVADFFAQAAI